MSSILTNNSAMVALQTLKSINSNLAKTQDEISTGKSVASAKDNAAVWAISKTMESDVAGFQAISSSLDLGEQTVAVGRKAAEAVQSYLQQMKTEIVNAQGQNYNRVDAQKRIDALKESIGSVVGAAQLNGLNLLSNTEKTAGTGSVNVLSSLDRSSTGVAAANIRVGKQDLGTRASNISATATALTDATDRMTGMFAATPVAGATPANTTTLTIDSAVAGAGFSLAISASGGLVDASLNTGTDRNAISYVARDGDTGADVAKGLADAFNRYVTNKLEGTGISDTEKAAMSSIRATVSGSTVTFTGATGAAADTLSLQASGYGTNPADTTIGGGLAEVTKIDVRTDAGAKSALTEIEGLLKTATAAAANFGSAQGRIETQSKFISGLTDSLRAGIGALVDANMEEASARLQALQVQQQLGVQALSIANQAPQSIMSLFR